MVAYALLNYSKSYKYGTRIYYPQMLFLHNFPGPSSKYSFANERTKIFPVIWRCRWLGYIFIGFVTIFFAEFRNISLRWLKTVPSTFQDLDFDGSFTLHQLMLQSWYQKTAQSLVNTLVLFSWHNRLPWQQYDVLTCKLRWLWIPCTEVI